MAKIEFDKYYTPPIVAKWCIEKVYEIIGKDKITQIVEPSAGAGSFSHQIEGCLAMDLYPQHEYIEKADFITNSLGYKRGRLFIGNPPFGGSTRTLLRAFYDKSVSEGDYIAWILPASFYNNYATFNKFEIVYSCLLTTDYTNRAIPTAFVIYKRNVDKDEWRNPIYKTDVIELTEYKRNNKIKKHPKVKEYDYAFSTWGQIFKESQPYKNALVTAVSIKNEEYKDRVIKYLKWLYKYEKRTNKISMYSVGTSAYTSQNVHRLLQIQFPELYKVE